MVNSDEPRRITLHKTHNDKGKRIFRDNHISTTKYNVLTFLPKNLFEQFSRIANFYFLVIVCLLQFPWAPISAAAAIVPLVIVIGITMIREMVEDLMRWRNDQKINATIGHILDGDKYVDIIWSEISVGSVIKIMKDEQIPADVIILSTDHEDGLAYIDTCNLDGETNLKVHQALPDTKSLSEPQRITDFQANIVCDQPNNKLYTFNGYLEANNQTYSLSDKQVLLRGCVLKNTHWAIGAVVYTGLESKLMTNSSAARSKRSSLERGLNMKLLSVFIFLLAFAFIGAGIGYVFEEDNINTGKHWYFYRNEGNKRKLVSMFFILLVSHIVIINAIIPISLYVTLEIVRVFQGLFVAWDAQLYDVESQTPARARTTNISDDLGQIRYVFSDKTGTLTRNVMEFMKCSISGKIYGRGTTEVAYAAAKRQGIEIEPPDNTGEAFKDEEFMNLLKNNTPIEIKHFLYLLSMCHAVIPEEDPSQKYGIAFQASSPDEGALVEAAANFGYVFTNRTSSGITVNVNGEVTNVEVLANIEFTSERKRSSVIIRHPETKEIVLYCKGADDLIFQRLAENSPYKTETLANLKEFAANGLRTLCCAYRVLDEEFYDKWSQRFLEANCSINDRDAQVNTVATEVESDLILLGATAIEDKLQIGVSEAIESLLKAGINVWVITGDKRETAINIGFACSLLSSDMKLIVLDSTDQIELMKAVDEALVDEGSNLALVASGAALYYLLDEANQEKFYQLSKRCQSVICCRVSPLQKATIVRIMREKTKSLALAIGDGANDVGMILQADVGIGISGKEGRQAVLSADYSFGQFRFLKKLLLVHGRINFYRNVDLVFYSFYKNMAFSINQIVFGFFSSNSGNTMYDSILYTVFNVIFTSVPPVIYAALERDVSMESMMRVPELFNFDGKREWMLSYVRFWLYLILGMYHGLCSFFIPYFAMTPFTYTDGTVYGLKEFSVCVYFAVVILVNFQIASMSAYWTWLHHLFYWASILIFLPIALIVDLMGFSNDFRGLTVPLMGTANFYFPAFGAVILGVIPTVFMKIITNATNTVRNRVSHAERSSRVSAADEMEMEDVPKNSDAKIIGTYPDKDNETGYAFDAPLPLHPGNNQAQSGDAVDTKSSKNQISILVKTTVISNGLDQL